MRASAARTASIWTGTRTWRAFSPSRSSSSATRRSSRRFPLREIRAGLAEAVKAGIIGDEPLFGLIERVGLDGLCADPEAMDKVVVHSVRLKAAVVSRDEREHGERRKLNLGHTFGHAVEKCSREMIHGEAVAVGMAIAARLAVKLGLLAPAACDRIVRLLAALGFATEPPVPAERLLAAVTKDKKSEGDTIRLVLPTAVGACEVRTMTFDELSRLVRSV